MNSYHTCLTRLSPRWRNFRRRWAGGEAGGREIFRSKVKYSRRKRACDSFLKWSEAGFAKRPLEWRHFISAPSPPSPLESYINMGLQPKQWLTQWVSTETKINFRVWNVHCEMREEYLLAGWKRFTCSVGNKINTIPDLHPTLHE